MMKLNCALVAIFAILLLSHNFGFSDAKRFQSSNHKTSSGRTPPSSSGSGHVTKPSYPTQNGGSSAGNSHADLAKLSYSGYNSAPNRPAAAPVGGASNSQPIGWNVPKSQGPPPAYSASNPAGGAHTNMHEQAPAYRPNNAAPPSYGASVSNVHTPITATHTHGVQSSYPGASYHSPGALPAGATYYSSPGQLPAGATYHSPGSMPAGASYYPSGGHYSGGGGYYPSGGHMPAGGGYYPSGGMPQGATYVSPGAALPPGAVFYSSPPQQTSSGLGFGSGLAAGAIGGALLGHALTPTHTRVVESAPAAAAAGQSGSNDDKIIIINNGPPGSVTTNAAGATVINAGAAGENGTQPAPGAAPADPAIPNVPLAPMGDNSATPVPGAPAGEQMPPAPGIPPATGAVAPAGEQPPPAPGGIICVPVRINETDPADKTKMIEVEKIACYPAPPPPPAGTEINNTASIMPPAAGGEGGAPLAPFAPVTAASQQLQASPTQVSNSTSGGAGFDQLVRYRSLLAMLLPLMVAFVGMR